MASDFRNLPDTRAAGIDPLDGHGEESPMKNVMVLIHDDDGQEARLQTALALTRALDGHLTCIDVADLVLAGEGSAGGAIVVQDTRAKEAINRAGLEPRLAREDVSWDWIDMVGDDPAARLLTCARCADLIVVGGRQEAAGGPQGRMITRLLGRTHALVVVAAHGARGLDLTGPVLIAWDGSDRAAFAMQRAVPLLALARSVCVLEIGFPQASFTGEEATTYLSRHDIHALLLRVEPSVDFAATIAMEAQQMKAAYCLMGAYKHRPLSEAIFGGVTRAMLGHADMTLILGH
jgi:nucleotide-binding universal stress UspA family protein